MTTSQLIKQAMFSADHLLEHNVEHVQLGLLLYRDWLEFYNRTDNPASRSARRMEQKLDWYLMRILKKKNVKVEIVLIPRLEVIEGVGELDIPIGSDKEKKTALNMLARMGKGKTAPCQHIFEYNEIADISECLGTITIYGELNEPPEIMSAVIHLEDGSPLAFENVLAMEHSPQEARNQCFALFDRYNVKGVFNSPKTFPPEFCEDCNQLLLKVANPDEVENILNA